MTRVDGSELDIVNAARVSHAKWKDAFDDSDIGLVKYLIFHEHDSPLRHVGISFRIKCPLFVHAQLKTHTVGVSTNTQSGRYVKFLEEFYHFDWRVKGNVKHGQTALANEKISNKAMMISNKNIASCLNAYYSLLKLGIATEQARSMLPTSVMTNCISHFSLSALAHFYYLRSASNAQLEIQEIALQMEPFVRQAFPNCWRTYKKVIEIKRKYMKELQAA